MNIRARLVKVIMTAVAGLAVLIPTHALADVITVAPSSTWGDRVQADWFNFGPLSQQLALPGGSITINTITWWGSYDDELGNPLADSNPPYADDFVVTLNGNQVSTSSLNKLPDANGGGDPLTKYVLSNLSLGPLSGPTTLDIINNFNDPSSNNPVNALWYWQGAGPNSLAYEIEFVRGQQQVPEPESLLLLALGLAGLGLSRRRRQ